MACVRHIILFNGNKHKHTQSLQNIAYNFKMFIVLFEFSILLTVFVERVIG